MKTCIACGHSQEGGKFCGKCGASLENSVPQGEQSEVAATQEIPTVEEHKVQSNESLEKVKEQSKKYVNYLIGQLKTPSAEVPNESSFKNALISVGLFILLTVIGIFAVMKGFMGSYGPSFIQVVFYMGLFFALLFGVNLLAIYVTTKLFSENQSFKEVICQVGNYFAVPIAIVAVGLVLALIKSMTVATFLIYIGLTVAFGIVPIFVVLKSLNAKPKGIDSFYAFLFYIVFMIILVAVLTVLIADSFIGEIISLL